MRVLLTPQTLPGIFGLTLILLDGWLMTTYVFPTYEPILPISRDLSTLCYALALLAIALAATWRPKSLKEPQFTVAAIALSLIGFCMIIAGSRMTAPIILLVGACLAHISLAWPTVMVGVALSGSNSIQIAVKVTAAFILYYLAMALLALAPVWLEFTIYLLVPTTTLLLTRSKISKLFASDQSDAIPADRAITKPSSYLPFGHPLFVCWFFFKLIYGYSLSFDETAGTPLTTFFGFVPLVLIAAFMLMRRRPFNPDALFRFALLLVIAGLMMVPAAASFGQGAINNILAAGVTLAELTLWFVLLALASRNWLGATSVIAWGTSLSFIGIDIGAALGRLTNISAPSEPAVATGITVAITLMMLAYTLFLLKDFNFSSTISGVQPDQEIVVGTVPVHKFTERGSTLAARHHLTQRESEVLTLLARGRSINYIRDELVVSRNTVKAHVKHIYLKLGVHTQQQIIDLFEMD